MDDLNDLERRLSAALDRIGAGAASLVAAGDAPPPADPNLPDAGLLLAQLDAEREVTAQLEERLRVLRERHEERVADLEARLASVDASASSDVQAAPTRADLIADLAALREARSAERAEIDRILAELAPIVAEAQSNA